MVMKNGRIAEEGTHEGLMAENGEYSALIKTFHGMDGDDEEHTTSTSKQLLLAPSSDVIECS